MQEWVEIAIRSFFAVAMLFLLTRILGKKQISQLTFFEYITGITLGELAGFISTETDSHYVLGIVALIVWFIVPLSLELLTLKSKTLRQWFEGKGTVVIKKGKVLEQNLRKERYTSDELLAQLRSKNVFRIADVEFAMLEPSGDLSVLLKPELQPVTPSQLGIAVAREQEPQAVIMDGVIMDEPLAECGLSREWLQTELEKLGLLKENVFIGQVDSYGQLYVDLYDDTMPAPKPVQKQLMFAALKKCEADLVLYALSTEDARAKRMYDACSQRLGRVIETLAPIAAKAD
jgi:uncharacterized membrane protein YcaP (DUF421 family)